MTDLVTAVFVGTLLLVAAGLVALTLTYAAYAVGQALSRLSEDLSARVSAAFANVQQSAYDHSNFRKVRDEIRQRLRPKAAGHQVDQHFVRAAEATRCISAALKVVKTSMENCCDVQRFAAQAVGAVEMAEIEWDPLCVDLRHKVIDTIDVTLESLQDYSLLTTDPRVLKQSVALHSLRQICEDCELMRYSVNAVPPLCTPAASM